MVTVPEIITSPPLVAFKAIFGLAASAVSIVIPLLPPVKVRPSRASTVTVRISLALPIFPVMFTVSVVGVPPATLASIDTVSLLCPVILPTVIAPPLEFIAKLAPSAAKFIVPLLKLIVSPAVSNVVATLTSKVSPVVASNVVVPSKL